MTTSQSWPIEDVPEAPSLTFVVHNETKFGIFFKTTIPQTASGCTCSPTLSRSHPESLLSCQEPSPCLSVFGWMNSVMSMLEFALTTRQFALISGCWLEPNPSVTMMRKKLTVAAQPCPFLYVHPRVVRQLNKSVNQWNVTRAQIHIVVRQINANFNIKPIWARRDPAPKKERCISEAWASDCAFTKTRNHTFMQWQRDEFGCSGMK